MLLRLEDSPFESNYVPIQNYSMEVNENKIRKAWQEKWKVGKGEKVENEIIEKSRFIIYPDHLRRYGTLSNRNLSKKLKYTQTRFYGTVGARSTPVQRPSLFLSSVLVPSPPIIINQNNHPNSSRALFTLQAANQISLDINNYMFNARKLTNQRLNIPLNEFRISDCNECYKDVRQNNLTLCKNCADKKSLSRRKFSFQNQEVFRDQSTMLLNDPYNLMRRHRLGVGETNERSKIKREKKNANFLPYHEPSSRTYQIKVKPVEWKKKGEEKEEEEEEEEEEWIGKDSTARRKSILECDINAYDLNKSNCTDAKNSNELDEDFPVALSELKMLEPKLTTADVQKTVATQQENEKHKTISETKRISEIVLNGQRCNILDKSHYKYLCDNKGSKKSVTEIIVPEPDFPKRPPRRQKGQGFREVALKYSKPKSKSSPNLSIKSILKKAIENENPSAVLDLLLENENSSVFSERDVSSEKIQLDISKPNSKKNIQNTLKKKKQVQFKMTNSGEPNQSCLNSSDSIEKIEEKFFSFPMNSYMLEESTKTNLVRRSKSYEDLPVLTNDHIPEYDNRKSSNDDIERRNLHTKDIFTEPALKKSLSDRHLPFTLNKNGSLCNYNSSSCSSLFYDTMALRTRGLKFDSRKMFQLEKSKTTNLPNEIVKERESRLPDKNQGNIITYEEFRKLTEESDDKKPIYSFRVSSTTNNTHKCPKKTKIKPPAPSPPLRQVIKSKNGEVSLKISAERKQIEVPAIRCNNPNNSKKEKHGEAELTRNIPDFTAECATKIADGKTVVSFVTCSSESSSNSERPHLVTINSKNHFDGSEDHSKKQALHIFKKIHLNDTNKVTISVRNENEMIEDSLNSSTCTIIETGSNSAVIPIVSTNNKTTLIVGSSTNIVSRDSAEQSSFKPISPLREEEKVLKIEKPQKYFFPKNSSDLKEKECFKKEEEIDIGKIDPVEAVRRNLVPHICGREDNHSTLMEKIKRSREEKKQKKNIKPPSQITNFTNNAKEISVASSESLALNFQNEKISFQNCKIEPRLEDDSSSITSCSTLNSSAKNSSTNTSRSSSFRSNHYGCLEENPDSNQASALISSQLYLFSDLYDISGQEKDKLECEYEIRNGLVDNKKTKSENVIEFLSDEFNQSLRKEKTEKDVREAEASLDHSLTLPLVSNERENHKSNKSIFEGASKYDILNYLVDAKERVQEDSYLKESLVGEDAESNKRLNFTQDKEMFNEEIKQISSSFKVNPEPVKTSEPDFSAGMHQSKYFREDFPSESVALEKEPVKSTAEIERKDSGVGSETSNISRSKWQLSSSSKENLEHLCEDCDQAVETQITNSGVMYIPMICRKCSKRRSERKEIIQEIVETEEKYGRDLRIVLEEFWKPMLVAGLLTPDQLSSIFLNTEELLENSKQFTEKLKDTLEVAFEQGDEDLLTVNMGKLFLEMGPMLHAFESYCTRQGAAAILLANLEKEKELLRIFLRVSQMENAILRRMNLNSFLMVPVQRVTKYPLLLARLYKVTPIHQEGRDLLKEAQRNIEIHLEHMNSETRDISATKVWRRFSTSTISSRKSIVELELNNIKLRKMAIDILEWNHDEVRFVVEGKLLYTQPTENNWKKGKTVKLAPIFALLVTLGKPNSKYKIDPGEHELTFPSKTGIREATFLLLKEKCGRYSLLREPLYLDKIIICCESEMDDYFEIQELSTKDSFIFKSDDGEKTKEWYKQLQYHAQILGAWRKRRNALANIMINGMMARVSLH